MNRLCNWNCIFPDCPVQGLEYSNRAEDHLLCGEHILYIRLNAGFATFCNACNRQTEIENIVRRNRPQRHQCAYDPNCRINADLSPCGTHFYCASHLFVDNDRRYCYFCICQFPECGAQGVYTHFQGYLLCNDHRDSTFNAPSCNFCAGVAANTETCNHMLCQICYIQDFECPCKTCSNCSNAGRVRKRNCGHFICQACEINGHCRECMKGICNYCKERKVINMQGCGHSYCEECLGKIKICNICYSKCSNGECNNIIENAEQNCEHRLCKGCLEELKSLGCIFCSKKSSDFYCESCRRYKNSIKFCANGHKHCKDCTHNNCFHNSCMICHQEQSPCNYCKESDKYTCKICKKHEIRENFVCPCGLCKKCGVKYKDIHYYCEKCGSPEHMFNKTCYSCKKSKCYGCESFRPLKENKKCGHFFCSLCIENGTKCRKCNKVFDCVNCGNQFQSLPLCSIHPLCISCSNQQNCPTCYLINKESSCSSCLNSFISLRSYNCEHKLCKNCENPDEPLSCIICQAACCSTCGKKEKLTKIPCEHRKCENCSKNTCSNCERELKDPGMCELCSNFLTVFGCKNGSPAHSFCFECEIKLKRMYKEKYCFRCAGKCSYCNKASKEVIAVECGHHVGNCCKDLLATDWKCRICHPDDVGSSCVVCSAIYPKVNLKLLDCGHSLCTNTCNNKKCPLCDDKKCFCCSKNSSKNKACRECQVKPCEVCQGEFCVKHFDKQKNKCGHEACSGCSNNEICLLCIHEADIKSQTDSVNGVKEEVLKNSLEEIKSNKRYLQDTSIKLFRAIKKRILDYSENLERIEDEIQDIRNSENLDRNYLKPLGELGSLHETEKIVFSQILKAVKSGVDKKNSYLLSLRKSQIDLFLKNYTCVVSYSIISGDKKKVILGNEDGVIRIFNVEKMEFEAILVKHCKKILYLAIDSTSQYFVSSSEDSTLRLWDLTDYSSRVLIKEQAFVLVMFSVDSNKLLLVSKQGKIIIWDLKRSIIENSITLKTEIVSAQASTDFSKVFILHKNSVAIFTNLLKENEIMFPEDEVLNCCALSHNEQYLALSTISYNEELKNQGIESFLYIVELSNNLINTEISQFKPKIINSLHFNSDDQILAAYYPENSLAYSVQTGEILVNEEILYQKFYKYPELCLGVYRSGIIQILTEDKKHCLDITSTSIYFLSPNLQSAAYVKDQRVYFLNLYKPDQTNHFELLEGQVTTGILLLDNRFLTGYKQGDIQMLSLDGSSCIFKGHQDQVSSLYSVGDFLLSGSFDSTVKLWNIRENYMFFSFSGHTGKVLSVCLTLSQKFALSGGEDTFVIIWDISLRTMHRKIKHHYPIEKLISIYEHEKILSGNSKYGTFVWSKDVITSVTRDELELSNVDHCDLYLALD